MGEKVWDTRFHPILIMRIRSKRKGVKRVSLDPFEACVP